MKVTNIFKGLDLIECLKNYGQRFLTLYRNIAIAENIAIPKEKKLKKAKGVGRRIYK